MCQRESTYFIYNQQNIACLPKLLSICVPFICCFVRVKSKSVTTCTDNRQLSQGRRAKRKTTKSFTKVTRCVRKSGKKKRAYLQMTRAILQNRIYRLQKRVLIPDVNVLQSQSGKLREKIGANVFHNCSSRSVAPIKMIQATYIIDRDLIIHCR